MADKMTEEEKKVNEELRENEPGLTIKPPYLNLQSEPIPNPNIKNENGKN